MQQTFLPTTIEDYVSPQDPVRVYDAFVDALHFNALGISLEPQPGADEYYPKDMLKLILYAYSYGFHSSRKIERACYHNLSFQWLMAGQKPDYRTIARFRSKYKEQIKQMLKQCVRACIDLDLIEGNVLFTDGSKFRANASINQCWTKEKCEKYLTKIDEHIDRLMEECEKIDKQQDDRDSMVKLHKKIENKEKLVKKIQGVIGQLQDNGKDSINSTDPDSIKAKSRQGTHAAYNMQMTVDEKHGLIAQAEAISDCNDRNHLNEQIIKSSQNLGKKPKKACSDSGFHSMPDLDKVDKDIQLILPSQKQAQKENGKSPLKPFDKEQFQYNSQKDEYICPAGKPLKPDRVILHNSRKKTYKADKQDCQACQHFGICTESKKGRTIVRYAEEEYKEHLEKIYMSPEGQDVYQRRKEKVELVFGHFKRNLGFGQFMLRAKPKVDAETSILATCFNITRMITIIGVSELIMKLNGG